MLKREDVHIIAEAGTNNNGQLDKARSLAQIAKDAKADSVKFQIINPWGLYLPGEYDYGHYDIKEVIRLRHEGQMADDEYRALAQYCRGVGISFTASVFDVEGLDLLMEFDPEYIKIASCDLNHVQLLREVASRNTKMVISTGMSSFQDVEKTMNELARMNVRDVVLLHCVSVYPATLDQTNLQYIARLKKEFDVDVGFSDHTGSSIAACMALGYGATWFEKHFTEDMSQKGLDHAYAAEPGVLSQYVEDISMAIEALSFQDKTLTDAEMYTRKRARRSLYAASDLPVGHIITEQDVLVVRPEGEMRADEIDDIIGKPLKTSILQYKGFTRDSITS